MKTLLFMSVLLFSQWQTCFAQEISKSDILATVRHMQSLAADQKKALIRAQGDFTEQATRLQEQTILTAKFRQEAGDNARQRDVVLFAFAIVIGFYVGTLFGGEVMRDFPAPWSFVACAAVYLISGIGAYTFGRIVLASLAHFIP
jgi:predicted GNAT family N-acyltransferase